MKTLILISVLGLVLISTFDIPRVLQGRGRGRERRERESSESREESRSLYADCNADGTCDGELYVCKLPDNYCVEVDCVDNIHCDDNKVCLNHKCRPAPCTVDADCGDTTVNFCHPDSQICRKKRCSADADCTDANKPSCNPTYFYCQGASCAVDADCSADGSYFCNSNSICSRAFSW